MTAGEALVTFTGAQTGTTVSIWETKVDHNLDKQMKPLAMPRQKNSQATVEPTTLFIDLGMVVEAITFYGVLYDDNSASALARKNLLRTIIVNNRQITATWGSGNNTQSYQGNVLKALISETPGMINDGAEASAGDSVEKHFTVTLTLGIGNDK